MQTPVFEVTETVTFECSHHLSGREGRPNYERSHGHSFVCEVTLEGTRIPGHDWVIDLATFKAALIEVAMTLDHMELNGIEGLETPTMENICLWISEQLSNWLSAHPAQNRKLEISRIKLIRPTMGQACTYRPINKEAH